MAAGEASYYSRSAVPAPDRPALAGQIDADVCVIGGGIAGCSTALHLAERGYRVALLEAESIGWGASGRSGGQILAGFACDQKKLAAATTAADAKTLWDLSVEAVELIRTRVQRHEIRCDLRWGHLHAAIKPRQRTELLEWQNELEQQYDYRSLQFLDTEAVQSQLATKR